VPLAIASLALAAACATAPRGGNADAAASVEGDRWWKGNVHTHSLWSDGADYPEMIAAWYREHGYHFVVFTEHDMLQEGEAWVDINAEDVGWPPRSQSAREALAGYRAQFGGDWVVERVEGDRHEVRLRGMSDYRDLLEEPGRFLLIMGEEITDEGGAHVNVINTSTALLPRGGASPAARIRANLDAVAEQRSRDGRPAAAIVNHPNFLWALTASDIASIPRAHLFELYSGHTMTNVAGDTERPGTERMWDLMLAQRHVEGGAPIYAVASDDAHDYRTFQDTVSRPGRGWVVVRADSLTPDGIVGALETGDFYASTGIVLRDVQRRADGLRIEIEPEPGASYVTEFIGTRDSAAGQEVGVVLAVVSALTAEYTLRDDDLYVRARVRSSRPHIDPTTGRVLGVATAWVQPVFAPRTQELRE
jgi:hypothetical protein